jgi:DNA polymerase V
MRSGGGRISRFRRDAYYSLAPIVPLRLPTSDTTRLVRAALHGLRAIYQTGFNYASTGVHLLELEPATVEQKKTTA